MNDSAIDREQLLAQSGWVQGMVQAMVKDRELAEDMVQDALVAGIEAEPGRIRDPRSWLLGVARNLLRQEARAGVRRRRTEAAASKEESGPSSADLVARLEVQQVVVQAVLSLPDPFRSVLILRFYEREPIRRIAALRAIPRRKAETQVRKGLELLRGQLKSRLGSSWAVAVLPMAIPAATVAGAGKLIAAGTLLAMHKPVILAASILLASLATSPLWLDRTSTSARTPMSETDSGRPRPASHERESSFAADFGEEAGAAAGVQREPAQEPGTGHSEWCLSGEASLLGTPTAGLPVELILHDGRNWEAPVLRQVVVTTGPGGAFHHCAEAPGRPVYLRVRAAEGSAYGATGDSRYLVPPNGPAQDLTADFYPLDLTLSGRVVDSQGKSLAGATVGGLSGETTTDEIGRWTLPHTSHRAQRSTVWAVAPGLAKAHRDFHLGEDLANLDLHLAPEIVIHGRVLDEHGHPVEGARVSASGYSQAWQLTGPDGRYRLENLAMWQGRLAVFAGHEAFLQAFLDLDHLVPGDVLQADLMLKRGATVSGFVHSVGGTPMEGVEVEVGPGRNYGSTVRTLTDTAGYFELPSAPSGAMRLFASRQDLAPIGQNVEVPLPGESLSGVLVTMEKGREVEVEVFAADEEPVLEAIVRVYLDDGDKDYTMIIEKTDGLGLARLSRVPSREVTVLVQRKGYFTRYVPVPEGAETLRVQLQRSGVVRGRVVDAETGQPIPSFQVRLVRAEVQPGEEAMARVPSGSRRRFHSSTGVWQIDEGLEVGKWVGAVVSAQGYVDEANLRLLVQELDADEVTVFALSSGKTLRGVVVPARGGAPIEDAKVSWASVSHVQRHYRLPDDNPHDYSDGNGRFTLLDLPPEDMYLVVHHPDWAPTLVGPIEMPAAGDPAEIRVEMSPGKRMAGVVLDADGNPMDGVEVHLHLQDVTSVLQVSRRLLTDREGGWAVAGLPFGTYVAFINVGAGADRWTPYERNLKFTEDGQRFVIGGKAPGRITGTVEGPGVADGLKVEARHLVDGVDFTRTPVYAARTRAGKFELRGLPPGRYWVQVSRRSIEGGKSVGSHGITVQVDGEGATEVEIFVEVYDR